MQVAVRSTRWIEVNAEAIARIEKAHAEGLCLACMEPLDETRTLRHCHERCYRATDRAIKSGVWTEDERVAEGKLGEKDITGRPLTNPVSIEAANAVNASHAKN